LPHQKPLKNHKKRNSRRSSFYISVVKSEDYSDEKVVYSPYAETNIAPHGQIEEFCEFKPTEKGEYILYVFADFSIEGKDTTKDYEYECEKITITVV